MSEPTQRAAPPGASGLSPDVLQEGQRELEQYIREGYAVYLAAGVMKVGKTEMLLAYERQQALLRGGTYLAPPEGRTGAATPTAPGSLRCYPASAKRRKVVFVDASGEHFRNLYPYRGDKPLVSAAELEFLRLLTSNLRGVTLLIDLRRLWQTDSEKSDGARQVEIANWIVMLLRWLRYDGRYDPDSPIAFQDDVNRKLKVERRRLKIPVQVLFSQADQLVSLEIPAAPEGSFRPAGAAALRSRLLVPAMEDPLLLAYHSLPVLFGSLLTHCSNFRFDFIHSMWLDPASGAVAQRSPCGVRDSLGWLVDPDWSWPAVPTRFWIGVERRLDGLRGQGARWVRLAPPRSLASRG
jgi:hypothetical protein